MKSSLAPRRDKRRYRMGARAEAKAATRASIAGAWLALLRALEYDAISLDLAAARAGVTVQTVIRHFGSKEELFTAVARDVAAEEETRRGQAPVGDVDGSVQTVVAHYERVGDLVLRLVGQEDRFGAIREITDAGRQLHYAWVERAFGPFLADGTEAGRRRRRAQLVVLTDVFTWKLLRRDLGFGPRQTQAAMAEMVGALLNGGQ